MKTYFDHLPITAFFSICLPVFMLILPLPAGAGPAVDCQGTIQAWILSGYYKPGDCHCSGGQPVCSNSSSGGGKSKKGISSQDKEYHDCRDALRKSSHFHVRQ